MTDLATIRIPVDSSEMVRAVQESRKLERNIKLLVTALDSGTIGSRQYNSGLLQLKRQYQGLFTSTQQATARVRGFARSLLESAAAAKQDAEAKQRLALATKKAETAFALANQRAKEELTLARQKADTAFALAMQREREAAKQQAEFDRLALKYNRVYAASKLYEKTLNELNRAHQLNVISTQQHQSAIDKLNREYREFSDGTTDLSNRFVEYDASLIRSNEAVNQFGLIAQQTGYQVGDFLVQIQSGTNAFVAFGQQATQLAGLLYLIPGAAGAIAGTIASILIPTVTAIFGYFNRTSEEAKTFSEILQDISNDNETYQRMKESLEGALVYPVDEASEALREYLKLRQRLTEEDLLRQVRTGLGTILEPSITMQREAEQEIKNREENIPVLPFPLKERVALENAIAVTKYINETLAMATRGPVSELGIRLIEAINELERGGFLAKDMREQLQQLVEETGLLEQAQEAQNIKVEALQTLREREHDSLVAAAKAYAGLNEQADEFKRSLAETASSAAILADELGISLQAASRLVGVRRGRQPVIFDPRDPNFNPIAAEMERIRLGLDGGEDKSEARGRQSQRIRQVIGLTRELTEVERQRLDLMRSIEGSMESGFMAMVEGTKSVKDAFRSMARDIIAELYRVFVVKQIVGAISGAASLASFGLGSFRSSGGTVMPGQSYIVGEKGPEIIKPRHSGTVVPAHMSSQGGTSNFTQNLSISVTGSDAANVRMEVAKMIPQITEATKAAVIDARRRGGQMKAAFG